MASYVIKTREVPATIRATALNGALAVSVANTAGANAINFTPYARDVGTISYASSTSGLLETVAMPAGTQIGDIAFFFDGVSSVNATGTPSAGWTLFDSASTPGIGILKGYFKVMQTAGDLIEVVTGSQTNPYYSDTYKTIGVFRPDISIATLTLNLNPFVEQPPTILDKTLPMSSISSSAIGLIWYYHHTGMSNTVCSGSFLGSVASDSGSLPLFSVSNNQSSTGFVRYKTYNKDESRLDLTGINLGSNTTLFTYFSAEIY